jgi:hypothetical protein
MSRVVESSSKEPARLPAAAYQFSLRTLLTLLLIFSCITVATATWGWLFGWSATACVAAIALAVWSMRFRRRWAIAGATALFVLGIVPGVLVSNAPFREASASCRYCGMYKETSERWLMPVRVTLLETDASRWARRVGLKETHHTFDGGSHTARSNWFGGQLVACGGGPIGIYSIYYSREFLGEDAAIAALREYQSLLDQGKPTDAEALAEAIAIQAECIRFEREWIRDQTVNR